MAMILHALGVVGLVLFCAGALPGIAFALTAQHWPHNRLARFLDDWGALWLLALFVGGILLAAAQALRLAFG